MTSEYFHVRMLLLSDTGTCTHVALFERRQKAVKSDREKRLLGVR